MSKAYDFQAYYHDCLAAPTSRSLRVNSQAV